MKKWFLKITFIHLLILFSVWILSTQGNSISGKVSLKEGNPIPRVTVAIKGADG